MDYTRMIERRLYNNHILNKDKYPMVQHEILEQMEVECGTDNLGYRGYVYIREYGGKIFIDIYIYISGKMKRYVIVPGYVMPEDEEDDFLSEINNPYLVYPNNACQSFCGEIKKIMPEIKMIFYRRAQDALEHVYFSSHRSGVRELLYKAGLNEIATYISFVDEYNIYAANVEDAFDVCLPMLNKLNSGMGVITTLSKAEKRKYANAIYENYSDIINDYDLISEYQYRYLSDCYDGQKKPNKELLFRLGKMDEMWRDDYDVDREEIYQNMFDIDMEGKWIKS